MKLNSLLFLANLVLLLLCSCSEEDIHDINASDIAISSREDICEEELLTITRSETDPCCITFEVQESIPGEFEYEYWQVYIDNQVITNSDYPDGVFEYCFDIDEADFQNISVTYLDAFGNPVCPNLDQGQWHTKIFVEPCESCTSYICWEDFIGYFSCAAAITIQLPDGSIQNIQFENLDCDSDWCTEQVNDPCTPCPCPAEVPVEGGYCCIAIQIINILDQLGVEYDFDIYSDLDDCNKGGYTVPGFFISSDEVKILEVWGTNCDGAPEGNVEFNHDDNCE